jgi:membrane protein
MAVTTWFKRLAERSRPVRLLSATVIGWRNDRVSRLSASLSFYALLSLVPLLVTFHALFGLLVDQQTLAQGLDTQVTALVGEEQARSLRDMLAHAQAPSLASLQAAIGALVTFVTAAGVFIELKDSMDAIWKVPKSQRSGFAGWVRAYFAPVSMVLGFGFLLLISLMLDAMLSAMATTLGTWQPALVVVLGAGNLVIGWLVAALLFAAVFRWFPSTTVAWRDVWLGAAITASLFVVGRLLIGMYLGRSDFTGRYGPAGAVVALVVWIYYSAQILFTGAVFTREQARERQAGSTSPHTTPQSAKRTWLDDGGMIGAP